MTPVMTFGDGKSAKQAQRDTMHELGPAQLSTSGGWRGDVTTKRIRVWADAQYRAQNVKWQQSFEGPLELANVVLAGTIGVRFVADYRAWDRHVPGSTLTDELQALVAHDPGTDVFAVVGLTSSLPLVSATFDDLGLAMLGGRHLIVRGYADLEERKLYAEAFQDLLPEEREMSLQQRREHKTAVVLLHEIAHVLGADHDAEDETIMSASYSTRARAFSARASTAMIETVDARLGRGGAAVPVPQVAATPTPPILPAPQPSPTPPPAPAVTSMPAAPEQPAPPVVAGPHLAFHIDVQGRVLHAGRVVDNSDIDALLAKLRKRAPDAEILIKRVRTAPTDRLSQLVDRAKAAGFTRVSITMY